MQQPPDHRASAIEVIAASLPGIPSLEWVIERARNKTAAYAAAAAYIYDYSALRQGAHLSSDGAGVLLIHDARAKAPVIPVFMIRLRFMLRCVGLRRAILVLRRNKEITSHHPSNKRFLHVPYFGVMPGDRGRGAAIELKNLMVQKSNELGLPVYLETTQEQNRRVYERYGFEAYGEVRVRNTEFTTWLMRREPDVPS